LLDGRWGLVLLARLWRSAFPASANPASTATPPAAAPRGSAVLFVLGCIGVCGRWRRGSFAALALKYRVDQLRAS
jgi:hypothetical protein